MGYMGILIIIDPKPYSIYLRGTIGFRVQGLGFRVLGWGTRVWDLGCWVLGVGIGFGVCRV